MASILDVARYIVDEQGRVTTMKLQKLCYYSQAWALVWNDEPLFEEDFEAWANGPVSSVLFRHHRGLFVVNEGFLHDVTTGDALTDEQKSDIDEVLDYYGRRNPHWLSELTHMERPWREARGDCKPGDLCRKVIDKEVMREYYHSI